jgi:hypothetical protein
VPCMTGPAQLPLPPTLRLFPHAPPFPLLAFNQNAAKLLPRQSLSARRGTGSVWCCGPLWRTNFHLDKAAVTGVRRARAAWVASNTRMIYKA